MGRDICDRCEDYVPDRYMQIIDGQNLCPSCRIERRGKIYHEGHEEKCITVVKMGAECTRL